MCFLTGSANSPRDCRRYIQIRELSRSLSPLLANILPAVHALTGCDTTSAILGLAIRPVIQVDTKNLEVDVLTNSTLAPVSTVVTPVAPSPGGLNPFLLNSLNISHMVWTLIIVEEHVLISRCPLCVLHSDAHKIEHGNTSLALHIINQGHVECFDPRVRGRVGILDTILNQHVEDLGVSVVPTVTALKFRDALTMAVGTSTGHVLLYDLRSDKPFLIKDHQYELPIKSIEFHDSLDLVMSMDSKILKLWNRNNGKAYTAIEPGTDLNDLCVVPGSGLLFMATEAPKVLTYYIPSIGTAPKWCSFLDNLTEELEESSETQVYDDYKFLTRRELEDLGLSHLIGSNLLRAYMHGFFIDMRLYHKAKSIAEPFAYEKYRKNKIREKIEEERENRVRLKKLPKVNPDFARKLIEAKEEATAGNKKKMKKTPDIMEDSRFSAMFQDTDFHIDTTSEEFRLLNPVVSKLDKSKKKKAVIEQQFDEIEKEEDHDSYDDSSSDDEHTWTQEVKKQHKLLRQEDRDREREKRLKFYEIKEGQAFKSFEEKNRKKELKQTLAERLEKAEDTTVVSTTGTFGNKEMTFKFKKSQKELKRQEEYQAHRRERKQVRRSAGEITKELKQKPKYWMGKRVK
ncbi:ribosome biogenesis protein ENP2 [Mytilus galloprovincialis]|uniref:Ribosome biogenesis protein ENP2 n=1 Tax=Mytilus galloprovincialis TaxID=29158 RepID=A0A8B6DL02_MYTGA|nr:ribosome biogenesis protein ENP2 [Mytilus galloprovincialis]